MDLRISTALVWSARLISLFAATICLGSEGVSVWSRGVTGMVARSDLGYEFSLYAINQGKNELDGTWLYLNYDNDGPQKPHLVHFEASKDKRGIVWPDVKLEVRNEETGQWESIGKSSGVGKRLTVSVRPGSNVDLFVQLDAFKEYIGKCKSGRIVLTNGHESEFELKYLLPPGADNSK
jgi:hypothetical protein